MKTLRQFLGRALRIQGLDAPENRTIVNFALALTAIAMGLRLFFWAYTGRLWEDALITVLHSENFVSGLGMTHYRPGEPPLHGFTSPLSVLVPLMGDVFRVGFGLSFIKVASIFAGGLTILYIAAVVIHRDIRLPGSAAAILLVYAACEHHQILWGMSGMETQMAVLALAASMYYAIALEAGPLGIGLGFCMLARPDFAFWTVVAGCAVLARNWRKFVPVTGIAAAVYAPWIAFTCAYYGSPVPNTLVAKHYGYRIWTRDYDLTWASVLDNVWNRVTGTYGENTVFQPLGPSFNSQNGIFIPLFQDHGWICDAVLALAALGILAAVWRRQRGLFPVIGFVAVYTVYYVFFVNEIFGWYLVPFLLMPLLLAARGVQAVGSILPWRSIRTAAMGGVAITYLACFVAFLPRTFYTEKRLQEDVENQVRKQIGLYLGEIMKPNQSVGCECLGYIGYYSRRVVYDWPGLVSRNVLEFSRANPGARELMAMLELLHPDFIALRYLEYLMFPQRTWIERDYRIIASFEASRERTQDIFRIDANVDLGFLILARKGITDAEIGRPTGINPKHPWACRVVGLRQAAQGRLEEAVASYRKSLEIDPTDPETHYNLANTLTEMGRYEEAVREYQNALDKNPRNANALINLGVALTRLQRYANAVSQYQKALTYAPDDAAIYSNLGNALALEKRTGEAIAAFEQALRLDPASLDTRFNLANAFTEEGRFAEAQRTLEDSLACDPHHDPSRKLLAHIQALLRDQPELAPKTGNR